MAVHTRIAYYTSQKSLFTFSHSLPYTRSTNHALSIFLRSAPPESSRLRCFHPACSRISCTGSASMRYVTFRWRCVVTYFPRFTWPSTDRIRARMADPIRASPLQSRIPPSLLLPPRCKDPHLRPRGRRAMPRNGKYCDTPSAPASDPGLRPRRRQSDVRSHFPASKYRIRSPSISAESPDPLFLLIVRTVFPDLRSRFSLAVSFCIRFPSHFDFKRLIKKTPAPVFLQTAGVSLRLNTNHAIA